MTTISERWRAAKPFLLGLALGAVLAPAAAVWHGSLVTGGARDDQVRLARIDAQALICERMARSYLVETGDERDLSGYRGRAARNDLAARFAVMPGATEADSAVRRACSDRLGMAAA